MAQPVRFLYLSQEDVIAADSLNMVATIEAMERVLAMAHRGECIEPGSPAIYFEPTRSWRVLESISERAIGRAQRGLTPSGLPQTGDLR